jgi:hypothetical protein
MVYSHHCLVYIFFFFLVIVIDVKIVNILESIMKFSGKKHSLSLHLVEVDTGPAPDQQALDADSDRIWIRQNDPDQQHCKKYLYLVLKVIYIIYTVLFIPFPLTRFALFRKLLYRFGSI